MRSRSGAEGCFLICLAEHLTLIQDSTCTVLGIDTNGHVRTGGQPREQEGADPLPGL